MNYNLELTECESEVDNCLKILNKYGNFNKILESINENYKIITGIHPIEGFDYTIVTITLQLDDGYCKLAMFDSFATTWCLKFIDNSGKTNRINKPAIIEYDKNLNITLEKWCVNNKYHRLDGPAIITKNEKLFYIDGIEYNELQYLIAIQNMNKEAI